MLLCAYRFIAAGITDPHKRGMTSENVTPDPDSLIPSSLLRARPDRRRDRPDRAQRAPRHAGAAALAGGHRPDHRRSRGLFRTRLRAADLGLPLGDRARGLAQRRAARSLPLQQRLEPDRAAWLLAFDIAELAVLLFFTGGLQNPFAFLFLGPVLISATALPARMTLMLGGFAIACATLLVFVHAPLPWDSDPRSNCRRSM